jgi:hypothetical protein
VGGPLGGGGRFLAVLNVPPEDRPVFIPPEERPVFIPPWPTALAPPFGVPPFGVPPFGVPPFGVGENEPPPPMLRADAGGGRMVAFKPLPWPPCAFEGECVGYTFLR